MSARNDSVIEDLERRVEASRRQLETVTHLAEREAVALKQREHRACLVVADWHVLASARILLECSNSVNSSTTEGMNQSEVDWRHQIAELKPTAADCTSISEALEDFENTVNDPHALPYSKLLCSLPKCVFQVPPAPSVCPLFGDDPTPSSKENGNGTKCPEGEKIDVRTKDFLQAQAEAKWQQVQAFDAQFRDSQEQAGVLATIDQHERSSLDAAQAALTHLTEQREKDQALKEQRLRALEKEGSTAKTSPDRLHVSPARRRGFAGAPPKAVLVVSASATRLRDFPQSPKRKPSAMSFEEMIGEVHHKNSVETSLRRLQHIGESSGLPPVLKTFRLAGNPANPLAPSATPDPYQDYHLAPSRHAIAWRDALGAVDILRSVCNAQAYFTLPQTEKEEKEFNAVAREAASRADAEAPDHGPEEELAAAMKAAKSAMDYIEHAVWVGRRADEVAAESRKEQREQRRHGTVETTTVDGEEAEEAVLDAAEFAALRSAKEAAEVARKKAEEAAEEAKQEAAAAREAQRLAVLEISHHKAASIKAEGISARQQKDLLEADRLLSDTKAAVKQVEQAMKDLEVTHQQTVRGKQNQIDALRAENEANLQKLQHLENEVVRKQGLIKELEQQVDSQTKRGDHEAKRADTAELEASKADVKAARAAKVAASEGQRADNAETSVVSQIANAKAPLQEEIQKMKWRIAELSEENALLRQALENPQTNPATPLSNTGSPKLRTSSPLSSAYSPLRARMSPRHARTHDLEGNLKKVERRQPMVPDDDDPIIPPPEVQIIPDDEPAPDSPSALPVPIPQATPETNGQPRRVSREYFVSGSTEPRQPTAVRPTQLSTSDARRLLRSWEAGERKR